MKVLIGGDISITEDCERLFAIQDDETLFTDVKPLFQNADEVIVNLECAVTESENRIKKCGPNLKAPLGTVETLKKAGVTVCAISNNHIFDFGKEGANDTITQLEKNGISWTGFGQNETDSRKNYIFTDGKIKVAVIAVCEHEYTYALPDRMGARPYDPYDTNDDVIEAKKQADYVVVLYHGGKEHCRYPSPRLRKLCQSLIKHGADVVLCQHSHCVGCYEQFQDGHILYGQGNFHFIWDAWSGSGKDRWNNGLVVALDFQEKIKIEFIPVVVDGQGIRVANEMETRDIMTGFNERSESLKTDEWLNKWREYCNSVQGGYKCIPQELENRFGHYLDCEAHTDVWRELYKTWNHTNEK